MALFFAVKWFGRATMQGTRQAAQTKGMESEQQRDEGNRMA
jgi:hypothetical protein